MKKTIDYLLVGQGIAGSVLAFHLWKRNKSFLVVDRGFENGSSFVAAGLMNPLVLKRLTQTWRSGDFIAYNDSFYDSLNALLGQPVFQKEPLFKAIHSEDDRNFWLKKAKEPELQPFLSSKLLDLETNSGFSKKTQLAEVKQSAWLNTKAFLALFRDFLISKRLLLDEPFEHNRLEIKADHAQYKELKAKKVLFCEGAKIKENPYFNALPMGLNKGELLLVKIPGFPFKKWVKKGLFLLPVGKDLFRVGATFEWNWSTELPSEHKKKELLDQLTSLISFPFEVIEHEAGIRPSVKDRRPLLGCHPEHSSLALFNGLGSRACFMAPLLAEELLNHLENGISLHPESDLTRFMPG